MRYCVAKTIEQSAKTTTSKRGRRSDQIPGDRRGAWLEAGSSRGSALQVRLVPTVRT